MTLCLASLLLTAGAFSPAAAQVAVVDEGIFTITVGGVRVGREDFSIRRTLTDGGYVAQGNVLRGESRSSVVLVTDSAGLPLRFQMERFEGRRTLESTSGEYRRGLWSGRALRPDGESAREFRLPPVVIAADESVMHHAWLLLRFAAARSMPTLRPRALVVRTLAVESAGPDSVFFGLEAYEAVRWTVRDAATGAVVQEVWVDGRGRLLRVRVPGEALEAQRDEPPAETPPPAGSYEGADPLLTGLGFDAFAVACDLAACGGDPVGGPGGPADPDAA